MELYIPEGPPDYTGQLACVACDDILFTGSVEAEELVGIIQVHMYACSRRKITSHFKCPYHPQKDLWYYQESPAALRCTPCNRIVPQAEIQLASRDRTR